MLCWPRHNLWPTLREKTVFQCEVCVRDVCKSCSTARHQLCNLHVRSASFVCKTVFTDGAHSACGLWCRPGWRCGIGALLVDTGAVFYASAVQGSEPDGLFRKRGEGGERSQRGRGGGILALWRSRSGLSGLRKRSKPRLPRGAFWPICTLFWGSIYPPTFHHGLGLKIQDKIFTRRPRLVSAGRQPAISMARE